VVPLELPPPQELSVVAVAITKTANAEIHPSGLRVWFPSALRSVMSDEKILAIAASMHVTISQSAGQFWIGLGRPLLSGPKRTDFAVVETETVAVTGVEPLSDTEAGEIVQVAAPGAPAQDRDTSPLRPPPAVNERV
jgi:hypothetical protein